MSESIYLPKRLAAQKSVELIKQPSRIGLGTGSTADLATEYLAKNFNLQDFYAIPTSLATEEKAKKLGYQITHQLTTIDYTIDGADYVDTKGNLIKGYGGALLREKLVAEVTKTEIIVVDETKLTDNFENKWIPVEVIPFGSDWVYEQIKLMGAEIKFRQNNKGEKTVTDNCNYILDCKFAEIKSLSDLDNSIKNLTGVVTTGLFLGLTKYVVVGYANGFVEIKEY